jgi:ribonuclease PH
MAAVLRGDGRTANAVRELSVEYGMLSQPDGSARLCHGDTQVFVGVYGPGDPRVPHGMLLDRSSVVVSINPEVGAAGQREKDMERVVRGVFANAIQTKLFPRAVITINAHVAADDGGVLAAIINCASMALVDAAVPMLTVPCAVSAVIASSPNAPLLVDPTAQEEKSASASIMMSFPTAQPDLGACIVEGVLSAAVLQECVSIGNRAAATVRSFLELSTKGGLKSVLDRESAQSAYDKAGRPGGAGARAGTDPTAAVGDAEDDDDDVDQDEISADLESTMHDG